MSQPCFSVITPSFNQARFLRDNIESVIAQDYPGVEHIVIDNASTDGSVELLREYPSVQWLSEPDRGQSDALNKGISRSRFDWIVWVNSDDFLLPGALQRLADHIVNNRGHDFIYSNIHQVDAARGVQVRRRPNYSRWKLAHWWWCALQLWQPGTVFKRAVFDAVGPLDISLNYAMDFAFFLKAQERYDFHYLDAELVAFRLHDCQKGHANEEAFIEERITATLAYWRRKNVVAWYGYRMILFFVAGSLQFVEGLRLYERGDGARARKLLIRGLRRNPLAWLRPEHGAFWLRKILGPEQYARLRRAITHAGK